MEDPSMTAAENDEFQKLMKETKAKLGPNSRDVAEDLLLKNQMNIERKIMGKATIQEKISLVKMEYFLYVFVEA